MTRRAPTEADILAEVQLRWIVNYRDLCGRDNAYALARAREDFVLECRRRRNTRLADLGAMLGGRRHSTIGMMAKRGRERLDV